LAALKVTVFKVDGEQNTKKLIEIITIGPRGSHQWIMVNLGYQRFVDLGLIQLD
jgi:hypothetical protein